jgi:hypothetical protein
VDELVVKNVDVVVVKRLIEEVELVLVTFQSSQSVQFPPVPLYAVLLYAGIVG